MYSVSAIKLRRKANAFLLFALLAVLKADAENIQNGLETAGYPSVVQLDIEDGYSTCSGTIVGEDTVLTAAHCLRHSNLAEPNIQTTLSDGKKYHAIRAEMFPQWRSNPMYDIGLIRFSKLPAEQALSSIRIYPNPRTPVGKTLEFVGYGSNDGTSHFFDGSEKKRVGTNHFLLYAPPFYLSLGAVRANVYQFFGLRQKADGTDAGSGSGDSGGPVFLGDDVVGVQTSAFENGDQLAAIKTWAAPSEATLVDEIFRKIDQSDVKKQVNVTTSLSDSRIVDFIRRSVARGYSVNVKTE